MKFDCLIIGGGVAGMQTALLLGSAQKKAFVKDKKIGVITHQRSSHLENALFNNVLGIPSGTLGKSILSESIEHLNTSYVHIQQIPKEKVIAISESNNGYLVKTNKSEYLAKFVVLALNYAKPFTIKGLEDYLIPHQKANPNKDRIQLRNNDHFIKEGLYCCGTIAGHRSQFAIAAGSGAAVATDILTLWNQGMHAQVHDKV
ncbi:FAD-dependent oxidoreductase [Polaribacter sp.]|uniref:FAD-dependent oxidoreductase n=1 Tax=Polaribacter sp. TaxID=1920175 RepID=UPI0025D36310|nr:FAD-dependent oxidoreductase [Polaribacter sp.]